MTPEQARRFVLDNTDAATAPLVPEITLRLATELTPLWEATEALLDTAGVAPPYWAFAWPGAQAIARHVLDRPGLVRGRRVLDWAAGSGLAAVAASLAGAAAVEAAEIDEVAAAAIALNAERNGAAVVATIGDVVGQDGRWDVVLAGDVCYERAMAARVLPWLAALARRGASVILADPGRAYLPRSGLRPLGVSYDVPVSRELEDRDVRRTALFAVEG